MKKKMSDQAIINTWIENTERYLGVADFELGGFGTVKIFKKTGLAHVFEIDMGGGEIFLASFERKK